jgi:hypothetical protein
MRHYQYDHNREAPGEQQRGYYLKMVDFHKLFTPVTDRRNKRERWAHSKTKWHIDRVTKLQSVQKRRAHSGNHKGRGNRKGLVPFCVGIKRHLQTLA